MRLTLVLVAFLVAAMPLGSLPGCGGKDGGPGTGGIGGAAGGGAGGGGGTSGGTGGGAGGAPSVLPSGTVTECFGDCPMGECDNLLFQADVACTTVYTAPVSSSSTYCNAGQTGAYCLVVDDGTRDRYFGIVCTAGTVSGKMCQGGCGAGGGTVTCN